MRVVVVVVAENGGVVEIRTDKPDQTISTSADAGSAADTSILIIIHIKSIPIIHK